MRTAGTLTFGCGHAAEVAERLLKWFTVQARDLPWRRTRDPYAIWISEIMLQQTQVKTVVPYWERWMRAFPTVERLASAPPQRVLKLWEGLGYYSRARNLQRAAQEIVRSYDGRMPTDHDRLLALPGIGRYTAGAITSIAYEQATPAVDGNVTRVLARILGMSGDPKTVRNQRRIWASARELLAAAGGRTDLTERPWGKLTEALMEFGAVICVPRQPRCTACPIRNQCRANSRNLTSRIPLRRPRRPAVRRSLIAVVIEDKGRVLMRQRPSSGVNADLWEFPTAPLDGSDAGRSAAEQFLDREFGVTTKRITSLGEVAFTIMHYRYRLEAFHVAKAPRSLNGRWLRPEEIRKLPLVSAHRRVWRLYAAANRT